MRRVAILLVVLSLLLIPVRGAWACSGPEPTLELMNELSTLAVLGTLVEADEHVIGLQVEEYLKGDGAEPLLKLNNHTRIRIDDSCNLFEGDGRWLPQGTRVLAFLQPDKAGHADWEVVWGGFAFIFAVEDAQLWPLGVSQRKQPWAVLDDYREQLAQLAGPPRRLEQLPDATPPPPPADGAAALPPVEQPMATAAPPLAPAEARQQVEQRSLPQTSAPLLPRIMLGLLLGVAGLLLLWSLSRLVQRRSIP